MDQASALLARFAPGPGRTGRVILHPRLTIVPLQREDFAGLEGSFATDVAVRVVTAADVAASTSVVERAAAYDEAIENIEALAARQRAADVAVADADRCLQTGRAELDRVAAQRARAEGAIAAAAERLAGLDDAGAPESDLRRELEAARSAAATAAAEYELAAAACETEPEPDLSAAERALADAKLALATVEAEQADDGYSLDAAAKQLQTWAAQRAVEVAQFDLDQLRERASSGSPARERAAAAMRALADAQARVDAAERGLQGRAQDPESADPEADAGALREQIEAVRRSVSEAEAARIAEVEDAQRALDAARRDAAVAQRELAIAIDRFEPGADTRNASTTLTRMRTRRASLDGVDTTSAEALLRICAQETDSPIMILVEPFAPEPADLVDAIVSVSEVKRIVLVTGDDTVIDAARRIDPEIGALRTALVTGGLPDDPALAQRNGNLL